MKRAGPPAPHRLFQAPLYKSSSLMALWAKREEEGAPFSFFKKKNPNEKGAPSPSFPNPPPPLAAPLPGPNGPGMGGRPRASNTPFSNKWKRGWICCFILILPDIQAKHVFVRSENMLSLKNES
nr:hypothetical protein [Morchella crassipes]